MACRPEVTAIIGGCWTAGQQPWRTSTGCITDLSGRHLGLQVASMIRHLIDNYQLVSHCGPCRPCTRRIFGCSLITVHMERASSCSVGRLTIFVDAVSMDDHHAVSETGSEGTSCLDVFLTLWRACSRRQPYWRSQAKTSHTTLPKTPSLAGEGGGSCVRLIGAHLFLTALPLSGARF